MNRADDAEMARIEKTETEAGGNVAVLTKRARVLAVRWGRGRTGDTTFLDWLIQRARNQGREVIVADNDRRNADLAGLYPGQTMQPPSDEHRRREGMDHSVLIRMAETEQSVARPDSGHRRLHRIRNWLRAGGTGGCVLATGRKANLLASRVAGAAQVTAPGGSR